VTVSHLWHILALLLPVIALSVAHHCKFVARDCTCVALDMNLIDMSLLITRLPDYQLAQKGIPLEPMKAHRAKNTNTETQQNPETI